MPEQTEFIFKHLQIIMQENMDVNSVNTTAVSTGMNGFSSVVKAIAKQQLFSLLLSIEYKRFIYQLEMQKKRFLKILFQ